MHTQPKKEKPPLPNKITNKLQTIDPDQIKSPRQRKDKSDYATRNKVLDKKTIEILEKLERRNILVELSGCVCSGKEANVFGGRVRGRVVCNFLKKVGEKNCNFSEEEKDVQNSILNDKNSISNDKNSISNDKNNHLQNVVIKIFRTSTIEFKNRSIYISSDSRFTKIRKSSSRELIKRWAEKEVRNLTRLYNSDVPTAKPIYLKRNIIIMEMIGDDNSIGLRLKDYVNELFMRKDLNEDQIKSILVDFYEQIVSIIHRMYKSARLVHCDLSEYNLLIHNDRVFVIDVGQSVDITHSYSDLFLLNDINNINLFFSKKGVTVQENSCLYESVSGKRMNFEWRGIDINKLGYEIDQEIMEKNDSDFSIENHGKKDSDTVKCLDSAQQYVKNKNMSKEEKLERRKNFKLERKMKRMTREKTAKVDIKKKRVKRKVK